MHDIWNPWHGCIKKSEGCEHCYMYYLDKQRDMDGSNIFMVKNNFDYPLQKHRNGTYKIQSGEQIRVCMTSDFFLKEADIWRDDVWDIIHQRPDVKFYLLTKRPERVLDCLPTDWKDGYNNVMLNVTCENQIRADERIPILLNLPFKHKGIMCAPFIGPVSITKYLESNQLEEVTCGGENYDGARPCHYDWVVNLQKECKQFNVSFSFIETGTIFIKDSKKYTIPSKKTQSLMAYKSNLNFKGNSSQYLLTDAMGIVIPQEELYSPYFGPNCVSCGSKLICNGCSNCGACKKNNS